MYNVVVFGIFFSFFESFFLHWKLIFTFKTCIKRVFMFWYLCAACLPASLNMHVPISELHAQCHWCLHFSMSLNSKRFLQFHPPVMLVAYVNSCFIRIHQNFFPVSFSSGISFPLRAIFVVQTGSYVQDGFHENNRELMDFLL